MRLIDVSEYSLKGAEIHWIEHDYNTINVHRKPLYEIPTVDAAPVKHGRWIEKEGFDGDSYYTCSACGCEWTTIDGTPAQNNMRYCPECGAMMDLEEQQCTSTDTEP